VFIDACIIQILILVILNFREEESLPKFIVAILHHVLVKR